MTSAVTIGPDALVEEAARTMDLRRISSLPVVEADGSVAGVLTKTDIVHQALASRESLASMAVKEVMNPAVISCTPQTRLPDLAGLMKQHGVHHLLVMEDRSLCGVVSSLDLAEKLLDICAILENVERR